MSTTFQRETLDTALADAMPLLEKHWEEIAHFKDIPLDPNYSMYVQLEEQGALRIFTARDEKKLTGYCVYFVQKHPHYNSMTVANQDVIYVDPERRGVGLFLMKFSDDQLQKEGVHVVSQHVKASHDFGPALERLGYELMDKIFVKRLN